MRNLYKNPLLTIFIVFLLSRVIYFVLGVFIWEAKKDYLNEQNRWTYQHKFLGPWTVWDSGFYYLIAQNGYHNNVSETNLTLKINPNTWLYLVGGKFELDQERLLLDNTYNGKSAVNLVVFVGDTQTPSFAKLFGDYQNAQACTISGNIQLHETHFIRNYLQDSRSCGAQSCEYAVTTYYSVKYRKVLYQEYFDRSSLEPKKILGDAVPLFQNSQEPTTKCSTVSATDFFTAPRTDISKQVTEYPFMPLYPYITGFLAKTLGINTILAGLIISNIALFLASIIIYSLFKQLINEKIAIWISLFYLLFPLNFIFSSFLTEGIFNFLMVLIFYFAYKQKYFPMGLLISLLLVTRITGFLIIVPIFILLYFENEMSIRKTILEGVKKMWFVPLPLLFHTYYLYTQTLVPNAILVAERAWGRNITAVTDFNGFIQDYLTRRADTAVLEIGFFIAVSVLMLGFVYGYSRFFKSARPLLFSFTVFSILYYVLPLSTGSLESFPRYSLGLLPLYIVPFMYVTKDRMRLLILLASFLISLPLFIVWSMGTPHII